MREIYMKSGQGFLLVFSITSLASLHELSELRDQIIRIKDSANVPMVLVGNKSDLEDDRAVSRARAFAVSQSWGNAPYYETSARRRANVDEVFKDLCRQIIHRDMEATNRPGANNYLHNSRRNDGNANNQGSRRHRRRRKRQGGGVCTIL